LTDDCSSQKPKHVAGNKTYINVVIDVFTSFLLTRMVMTIMMMMMIMIILFQIQSTVNDAITCISLKQIGYTVTDQYSNAVGKTRNFAKTCWLPRDFSDRCADTKLW